MRLLLGDNVVQDCQAALLVNGVEVFRLHERDSDGRLRVSFDVRGESDERLATIRNGNVAHRQEGYTFQERARESSVYPPDSKEPIARAEEIDLDTVRVTGDFWIDGHHVTITPSALTTGGLTLSGNTFVGLGAAVRLDPGSFTIGVGPE